MESSSNDGDVHRSRMPTKYEFEIQPQFPNTPKGQDTEIKNHRFAGDLNAMRYVATLS